MKKLFLLTLMMAFVSNVVAYDFSAVCESGQTLYYTITSPSNHEVAVTAPAINWQGYDTPVGDLVIPEVVVFDNVSYTVVKIDVEAFSDCQLTAVVIPDQCSYIGAYAFAWCESLASLVIGSAVDTIQFGAFEDCTGLQSILCKTPSMPYVEHIPSNLYYEDHSIFYHVPTDIPVYVSCLVMDQFQMSMDWSRFTNLIGVFLGAPSVTVNVNNPEGGVAEVVSVPVDCDETTATVRAVPNEGHVFGYWKRNGAMVSYQPEYTFQLNHDCVLTACFDCSIIVWDSIFYPDHVIGRSMNSTGQVTSEILSDFNYSCGELTSFDYPSSQYTTFDFYKYPDKPRYVHTSYWGHPNSYASDSFDYDNNQLTHREIHRWSEMEEDSYTYWDYYYDNNHLYQEDLSNGDDDYITRHLYFYEDNNRTRIDNYYKGYGENLRLSTVTTNHYNERQQVMTSQTDNYNSSGELTSRTLKTYSYTPFHKTDSIVTQNYSDESWVNSGFTHYEYDFRNRVVEYQTGSWSAEHQTWNNTKKVIFEFNEDTHTLTVSFRKKNGDEWVWDNFSGQSLFNDSRLSEWQSMLNGAYSNRHIGQFEFSIHSDVLETVFPAFSEWYYEIERDDGGITYQQLEYAADTTINGVRTKIIVRTNQIYDKDEHVEVTHEYIKESNHKVYWWNKELHEFTLLYDYASETGDEWEIKVGTESIMVHVDGVEAFPYEGNIYRMLHISDADNVFTGDIIVGIGHTTSFFPEKLMNKKAGLDVKGLRCYWIKDALIYHNGDEDCDAIHVILKTGEETHTEGFQISPNPTNGVIVVTSSIDCPQNQEYCITNLMGQVLMTGTLTDQTIDVSSLSSDMYFITIGEQTLKFVKQ